MAVPKKKKSHSRTRMGKSHTALEAVRLAENKKSGVIYVSHHIDADGLYNGRQVLIKRVRDTEKSGDSAEKNDDSNAVASKE